MIDRFSSGRTAWLLTIVVVGAAALLRLHDLPQTPFGWHPDEATKALLARDVLAGKYFPAFFSAFTGREALFVYLEAGAFALMGEHIFVARLLSAFSGILTVAFTYTLGRRLFNKRVALFAAVFLATSLWHLIASRNGYRAVVQPLVQLPALLLMVEALRTHGRRSHAYFVIAGACLGLSQYTYTAARFFPILIGVLVFVAAIQGFERVWSRRAGLALMAIAALVVSLPLIFHFAQNPDDFWGRATQVSVFSPEWAGDAPGERLWQSVKESARMFTVWGDINYRFNIAGEPVFRPLDGILFYLGLLIGLWRSVYRKGLVRFAYVALFSWVAVMILPMTLSAESLPYYQRAIGTLPAIYFFPAITLDVLSGLLAKGGDRRRRVWRSLTPFMVLVLLVLSGVRTGVDYFQTWNSSPRNDDDRRVAMVYVAEYLANSGAPESLYLSTQYVQHPTLALLAPEHYDRVHWFDASQSLPLPPEGEDATYLLLQENAPETLLLEAATGLAPVETGYDRFDRPVFHVYERASRPWPVPQDMGPVFWSWEVNFEDGNASSRQSIALPVNFGNVLAFRGRQHIPPLVSPGEKLEVVFFWEILERAQRPYTFFVHVLDANSNIVAGYDANTYATAFWPETGGELLLNYFPLQLPGDLPEGDYQIELGVYHQPSGERLPVLEGDQVVADRLLLRAVRVGAGG